ncbi:hydrogenase maturation protein [Streptomyces coelicoflavus]|uniref:hydrogenase maturation protein n=1 Tax=Streptomyces coelicoflavus TaxID=285562 RepID=UPI0036D19B3A
MDILLVASAFNSLSQRVYAQLSDHGHRVDVVLASHGDDAVRTAVRETRPELIIAPMLKTALPEEVWRDHTCLIVHPGPPGDRGPSSLDWAIAEQEPRWGVTVLQAEAAMDAGDIWAAVPCTVPSVGKSDLYRNDVADAAVSAVLLAVRRYADGSFKPQRQNDPSVRVVWRDAFRQERRRIDWERDTTETVLRKLRGADSQPGVLDELLGREVFLHGGHPEDRLRGRPGDLLATRAGAVCRATRDGAVWIPELRPRKSSGDPAPFRRPAASVLASFPAPSDPTTRGTQQGPSGVADRPPWLPEASVPLELPGDRHTWSPVRYRQKGDVGFVAFSFPGGAMSTDHCRRLLAAYRYALTRPTPVLVLGGARDFFSNGIHLNVIEAAADPAGESWTNLNAMDDLVEAVLRTTDRLVVAALGGNAAAGGAMLALAADEVWCRRGSVINPHYRRMGLYGSEFWTYTLPRRVGPATADRLTSEALPISAEAAADLGMVDRLVPAAPQEFAAEVDRMAMSLAEDRDVDRRITGKEETRRRDEAARPLASYREAELARMHGIFFDPEAPYHALRSAFVRKTPGGSALPLSRAGEPVARDIRQPAPGPVG